MTATSSPRAFAVDGAAGSWQAVRFGPRWNGWVTPVVDRVALQSLIDAASGVELAWEGSTAIVICEDYPDEPDRLRVDADGLYDLASLGWCFIETDRWDRPVVQCGYCGCGGADVVVLALHQRISPRTAICCDAIAAEPVPGVNGDVDGAAPRSPHPPLPQNNVSTTGNVTRRPERKDRGGNADGGARPE